MHPCLQVIFVSFCACAQIGSSAAWGQQPRFVSDDFNDCTLGAPPWTAIDPLNDASISVEGAGTGDAHLVISVPAGVSHNVWTDGIKAPRVMQPALNQDFTLEVKFDSVLNAGYQMQGVIIQQSLTKFLRFDFHHTGTAINIFAVSIDGGQAIVRKRAAISGGPSLYMRITRVGSSWTFRYSTNGSTWTTAVTFTFAMTVTSVGPFIGNHNPSPAFTGKVDYFVASLIVPEDPPGVGATLTAQTAGSGQILVDPQQPAYYCDETVQLTAVAAPGWHFQGWTGDLASTNPVESLVMSQSHTVTATFVADSLELVGEINVVANATSALVEWTTNSPSNSKVEYGLTPALELPAVINPSVVTNHAIQLSSLSPGSLYYARVTSQSSGGAYQSPTFTFSTQSPGAFVSEDFNICTLNESLWTVVDPLDDAAIAVAGAGTGSAHLSISVPAGVSHDVWANSNMAPRVMQPAANGDFEIVVKFDSPVSARFQTQGVIIEQNAANFMRFDFFHDGAAVRIFAATFAGSQATVRHNSIIAATPSMYMRIARAANTWTLRYSADGAQWTTAATFNHVLTVASVGPFAGNYNPAPAFTSIIDYFMSVTAPIVPEDAPFPGPGALLTTTVIGNGDIEVTPDLPGYHCGETVQLIAAATPGWLFDEWGGDLSGTNPVQSLVMDQSREVEAGFVIDDRVLEILNVNIIEGDSNASITWSTSKPATSQVKYGLTSAYELGIIQASDYVMEHAINLTSLNPQTQYHIRITSVDGLGASLSTGDLTFTTDVLGSFDSDDFNNFNLDPEVWTFVNPLGDAVLRLEGVNTPNARIEIDLPAGVDHSPWTSGNRAPRLMQQMSDVDFAIQARFEALMTQAYQQQGLMFEQSEGHFVRFDFFSDGTSMRLFAGAVNNGSGGAFINVPLPDGFPWHMRVERTGDLWRVFHSFTGTSWTQAGAFTYAMTVNAAGPFVANAGSNTPAFTGIIDYVFNASSPIVPEDGAVVVDTQPPIIFDIEFLSAADSLLVKWKTDEPADGRLDYGLTTSYELGSQANPAFLFDHAIVIGGLQPETTYHVRIASSDSVGHEQLSANLLVATSTDGTFLGPDIDIWYGDNQSFGTIGLPIPYVNILGKVDTENLAELRYSLNAGPFLPLSVGSDLRRLYGDGDFNVELTTSQLLPGQNVVTLRSFDIIGNESQKSVVFEYQADNSWPLPYSVHWADYSGVAEATQIIDGKWALDADSTIRPVELGYDRIVAIGDQGWTNYQATVPVTVFGIDPDGFSPPSNGPAIGLICHWPGHTQVNNELPRRGYIPLGAFGLYRWTASGQGYRLNGNTSNGLDAANVPLNFGVQYVFKMQVENSSGFTSYRFKSWPASQAEPAEWLLEGQQSSDNDPGSGCLLLVSHHVDARFGDVVVEPIP